MRRRRSTGIRSLAFAALCAIAWPCLAADERPQWIPVFDELVKQGRLDEATSFIQKKATERPTSAYIPKAMYSLSQSLLRSGEHREAYALLQTIVHRFPDTESAGLAWCSLGRLYGDRSLAWKYLGNSAYFLRLEDLQIQAFKRGFAQVELEDPERSFPANGDYNNACNTLGHHYLKTGEWEPARKAFLAWNTQSSCGTCTAQMNFERDQALLLCELQLAKHPSVATGLWRKLANNGDSHLDQMGSYLLVRLYTEADQVDDLSRLSLSLVEDGFRAFPRDSAEHQHRRSVLIRTSASLMELISTSRQANHEVLARSLEVSVDYHSPAKAKAHVERWTLVRERNRNTTIIEQAARSGDPQFIRLLYILNSWQSHDALVRLAASGDWNRLQAVVRCLPTHQPGSEELLERIVAVLPEREQRSARSMASRPEPFPLTFRFYEPWPVPAKGSLPKALPDDLFGDKADK